MYSYMYYVYNSVTNHKGNMSALNKTFVNVI